MAFRLCRDALVGPGKVTSRRMRPCSAVLPLAQQSFETNTDASRTARRSAAVTLLSAGLLCGQVMLPESALATVDTAKPQATLVAAAQPTPRPLLPNLMLAPPPLASTAVTSNGAAAVIEEAEEIVMDVVHFFQHSVEAVESTVHHLQVVHAMERLEGMPLNQVSGGRGEGAAQLKPAVVDLELLKAAMHPASSSLYGMTEYDEEQLVNSRLDSALDSVAQWQLRDVVDVGKLANALQDVQYSGPLDSRSLQREAPRLRRAVHWEAVAEAVRPPVLRQALNALAEPARRGAAGPFSELDIRTAIAAVRMDVVRDVLSPPKPSSQQSRVHSLDSSGLWTWDNIVTLANFSVDRSDFAPNTGIQWNLPGQLRLNSIPGQLINQLYPRSPPSID
ncbi:hypothetical protein VOLCADRAFT_105435 [Volvox carteri f. nagariensis]|uniref:Uncharacterized protein n=1 Tax=Volvox carteri f. nagariensis TaxID=3068 RepID=D8U0S4_VOLCA|nr:uncharacterized protein VOLCADRAFT_105435 [Volvox carteri f. nagariensis]EFJ46690.1 hypothetical protein VOLCADRAFT_105435 [Volvox carteri f. nagariensis]|eukprot:XP_002952219.1 hypothetical protein VOLCADRAFT_105435 [Volvox carteri f. nagariensis]